MKKSWLLAVIWLATSLHSMAQEQMSADSLQQAYEKKKKTAKTLMIAGGVSMGAGIAMGVVAIAQVSTEVLVPVMTLQGNVNENAGEGAAIASAILGLGGTAMLVTGLIMNGHANNMRPAGTVYLRPVAPPIVAPGCHLPQSGITLGIRLSRTR